MFSVRCSFVAENKTISPQPSAVYLHHQLWVVCTESLLLAAIILYLTDVFATSYLHFIWEVFVKITPLMHFDK